MTIRNGLLSWAEQKPLGPQTEPPIKPRVAIVHIIVGSATAGYNVFKANGYTGDESTFILCGPHDTAQGHKDGDLWQIQNCQRQADAQFAGNAYADSWECSGFPNEPMTSAMMQTLIKSMAEVCEHYDIAPQLVPATGPIPAAGGLGWHERRHDWNLDGHVCPGAVREGQLRQIVFPKVRAIVNGQTPAPTPAPKPVVVDHPQTHLTVDGIFGLDTCASLQQAIGVHVDGIFGPATRRGLQTYLQHRHFYDGRIDSIVGSATVKGWKAYLAHRGFEHGMVVGNGTWGPGLTANLQRALNAGKF